MLKILTIAVCVSLGCGGNGGGSGGGVGDGGPLGDGSLDAGDPDDSFAVLAEDAAIRPSIDGVMADAGEWFVTVQVTVQNHSAAVPLPMSRTFFTAVSASSLVYQTSSVSDLLTPACQQDVAVAAGGQNTCRLAFEIAQDETLTELVYDDTAGHRATISFPEVPGYPPGPYGTEIGDTIENLSFQGRRDDDGNGTATDDPVRDIWLSDYQYDRSGLQVLVIAVEAAWVSPSAAEQPFLVELFEDEYEAGGLVAFLDTLMEADQSVPAEIADLDDWATTHGLPFDLAIDPTRRLFDYIDPDAWPAHLVIRLSDMTISWSEVGAYYGPGPGPSQLKEQIDAVLADP